MSKKKIFNIIELVLQILAIILLFADGAFFCSTCQLSLSFMSKAVDSGSWACGPIVLTLFIINSILCIISIRKDTTIKDSAWHTSFPIINFIVYSWCCYFTLTVGHQCFSTMDKTPLTYITILISVIIVFLGFVKRSNAVVPKIKNEQQQVINNIQEPSNADELKKYKDLLDSGIITQEEFDQKKKQLLGL